MPPPTAIQRLLRPQSIAAIGGDIADEVMRQCKRIGFQGDLWCVNPKRSQTDHTSKGYAYFNSVHDLPYAPDAAFIAVPKEQTVHVVRELAQLGTGGAVCYASGFAEIGAEGAALQSQLTYAMGDMALVGPNCYGLLNYLDGIALWPDEHGGEPVHQGVAIILQSGNIGLTTTMQRRGLQLAYLITVGNQAGLKIHDYVDALLLDSRVRAIGLHVEGLSDVSAFSRSARQALRQGVPLVMLKTGTSHTGRTLTLSHTSSLAGSQTMYEALLKRYGITAAHTLPEFLEMLKFLAAYGPLPAPTLASISCSGGEAALAADLAEQHGLNFATFNFEQKRALKDVLGSRVTLNNPLDYHTYIWGNEQAQRKTFQAVLEGSQAITFNILDYPDPAICDIKHWDTTARAFAQALKHTQRPGVFVSTLPEGLPHHLCKQLTEMGIIPMQGLNECLSSIRAAYDLGQAQHYHDTPPLTPSPYPQGTPITLNEWQSKERLASHGIPTPRSQRCSAVKAPEVAEGLGFPVAVKFLSSTLVHKSDAGAVKLNLHSSEEVEKATNAMRALAQTLGDDFLVEPMAAPPLLELILGITRDEQFGLALVIGAGGVWVEVLKDTQTLLLPTSYAEIERAIQQLKIAPLLAGYRGQPAADMAALCKVALALADFAVLESDRLLEIDINPLFVYPQGKGVLAVDALIRLMVDPV